MKRALFLQDIGVDRGVVDGLIADAALPLVADWEDWARADRPEDVFALVTVRTAVDDRIFGRMPNLRMIAVAFTGYDCVDLDACRRRGIAVYNVPAYSTDSVAELALALAVCLLRDIPQCNARLHAGDWKVDRWGTELAGKTVGILGTGAIGLRTAELFRACRCRVIGWSRTERPAFIDLGGTYRPMDQLLSESHVVSIHVPLTPETEGLIGERELALMRPGACLINTARGRVADTAALIRAAQERRVRAALDVFDQEPLPPDDPLTKVGDILLTPHIAFKTHEALHRRARVTIENIQAFMSGSDVNRIA